jgi:HSP20 family protein
MNTIMTTAPISGFDTLFNDIWKEFESLSKISTVKFPYNLKINEDSSVEFEFALAGYDPKDIDVAIDNDKLVISTIRAVKDEEDNDAGNISYFHRGIKKSAFKIEKYIGGKFDTAKATADFKNGILIVKIPMREDSKPRKLKIAYNED